LSWLNQFTGRRDGFEGMSRGTASETRCKYFPVSSAAKLLLAKVSEAVPLLILEVLA
jgi:hypothetical protein